ncbi:MAG TPA: MmgE/PrpD family protein [Burkholderiales bacterium]|nr:MmgE/PrpD family protein [Burkholderiales bacterium]
MTRTRSGISPLAARLSTYIAGAAKRKLPLEIVERAKIHLVDTIAAMVSGARLAPGKKALEHVTALRAKPEAGVVASRFVTSAPDAALANGMCGHADETDDTIMALRLHPGTCVVPAALAVAEREQLAGTQVLRAIVLGYDVSARVLLALRLMALGAHSRHHGGAIGGSFGATAACAALLGLDARRVRYALAYAGQNAAGMYTMLRDSHHVEKAYVLGGMPARNGVSAALMAAQGFTGVEDIFAGVPDFFSVFSEDPDPGQLTRALGREYQILNCSIKRWSVGAPAQAPLQVLHELIQQHGFAASDVTKIIARMPKKQLQVVDNRDMPDICVQHLLALMLVDGTVTFRSAHDYARMKDARVLAARKRIEAVGDAKLEDSDRTWRCAMEVTLRDGRTLTHRTMAARGWFKNPQTRDDMNEKALDLMGPVLGERRTRKLLRELWRFDEVQNVRDLRKLLAA